ncbi:MAG: hypothetical protein AD742_11100 [Methylibium sp. NZG]|nr:MAG: hypothetical protein AD742_11100 [Methylibium sp. NZG]
MLVQLRFGADLPAVQTQYRLSLKSRFGSRPIFRFQAPADTSVDDAVSALRADPRVVVAEPNYTAGAPEARKRTVWAIGEPGQYGTQWAPAGLALPQAHTLATGQGLRVAVLDTGADLNHPALAGRLVPGRDFVDDDNDPSEVATAVQGAYGHGTHVAGLVALAAPGAKIMPLRVLDAAGEGNVWVLAEALLYAVDPDGVPTTPDGARVVNFSLGTTERTDILDLAKRLAECDDRDDDDDEDDKVALDDPGYQGDRDRCNVLGSAVVISAAGNSGNATERLYPAAEGATGSLAVAASNAAGRVADFSNRGSWIDLAAPGDGITSAIPGGRYAVWSGTSMAAPLTAGVAALLFQQNPDWKPEDVTKRLRETSVPLCGTVLRQVNADAAVRNVVLSGPICR